MSRARPGSFAALALAGFVAGPGCLCLDRKSIPLAPNCAAACDDVPCACRCKIYLIPPTLSAGQDVQIPESFPANVTANALTVETLARALANVAGSLPRPEVAPPPQEMVDDTPTPRPIARTNCPPDAWDFLKPMAK